MIYILVYIVYERIATVRVSLVFHRVIRNSHKFVEFIMYEFAIGT